MIVMSDRFSERTAFIASAGWGDAAINAFPGDASSRQYFRLTRGEEVAVLMDAPRGAETAAEPEGATVEEREALGYNAVARLAGPEPAAFAAISNALTIRGFSAPKILATDLDAGLLLLEDFGQSVYAKVIETDPQMEAPLYEAAVECLAEIYRSSFPAQLAYGDATWRVREYDETALWAETHLFLDWYAVDKGVEISGEARKDWNMVWRHLFSVLTSHSPGLALRDFHAENLFWLPERDSVAKIGLIDFQDGLFVHPAYDLVSFLEDARRDVSPELVDPLISQFCEQAKISDEEVFRCAYAVLGAQRNAKILGIFVRLAERDGKPAYRELIPRVRAHFLANLQHRYVRGLRHWFEKYMPEELL
jgi:aminoglycoside/choline kinase family phosphotransferase